MFKKRVDKNIALLYNITCKSNGGIAQLGERLNGIQEVSGSIPLVSTIVNIRLSEKSGGRFFMPGHILRHILISNRATLVV